MEHLAEWSLAIAYLALGPGAWVIFWFAMLKGRARLRLRPDPMPRLVESPRVSVVVPCRDEAEHIEACVNSILAQDWPDLELVVVNDRSTDDTPRVLETIRHRDPRLRVIHVREADLPAGWFGKNYAMHLGAAASTGDWMVFTDSDCRFDPQAVRAGVTTGIVREFDLVSFTPMFERRGFWDALLTPLGGIVTTAMFTVMYANSAVMPRVAFACGQFMAIRRPVYDAIGGWQSVRHLPSDDVEMARLLKRSGYRPRVGWGMDLVRARMYDSWASVWRGWSRNFIIASRGKPWRVMAAMLFVTLCVLSFFAAVAWGLYRWLWPVNDFGAIGWIGVALAHAALMTLGLMSAYRWGRNNPVYALLWPVGVVALLAIFTRSLYLCAIGRIEWRGARYSLRMKDTQERSSLSQHRDDRDTPRTP